MVPILVAVKMQMPLPEVTALRMVASEVVETQIVWFVAAAMAQVLPSEALASQMAGRLL